MCMLERVHKCHDIPSLLGGHFIFWSSRHSLQLHTKECLTEFLFNLPFCLPTPSANDPPKVNNKKRCSFNPSFLPLSAPQLCPPTSESNTHTGAATQSQPRMTILVCILPPSIPKGMGFSPQSPRGIGLSPKLTILSRRWCQSNYLRQ